MAQLRALPSPSARPRKSSLKSTSLSGNAVSLPRSRPTVSKKEKRRSRHEQLLSKVTKTSVKPRRRRASKKLITTLDSLADALPQDESTGKEVAGPDLKDQMNVIRRKSVKSKPGALKRREKVDKVERERFARNMAQLTQSPARNTVNDRWTTTDSSNNKWASLRTFISQTLEQRPDSNIGTK